MKQPFIKFHQNGLGAIVITYIGEASFGDQVTPEVMVIGSDDIDNFVASLKEYYEEIAHG